MKLFDIIKKDVLIILRDIQAMIFIIIMPIVLIVILSLALGGMFRSDTAVLDDIHIAVVDNTDEAETAAAVQLLSEYKSEASAIDSMSIYNVLDSKEVSEFLSYEKTDADTAHEMLESGAADAVVTIPEGATLAILTSVMDSGSGAEVTVEASEPGSLEAGVIESVVAAWADAVSAVSADIGVLMDTLQQSGGISQQVIESLDVEAFINSTTQTLQQNASVNTRGVTARIPVDSFMYYSIAITCMFILYSSGQGSTFIYSEYEEKTLMRLLAAGISKRKLLIGKGAAVFCLCALQLVVLLTFSSLALGVNWGDPINFILISLCVAVSVTGLGVLLMVLVYRGGNPRIGNVFQAVIVQALGLFGGSFIPLSTLPAFFSSVSLFTPNGLALRAYTENATGAPLIELLPFMGGCLIIGVVLAAIGIAMFPRERRA